MNDYWKKKDAEARQTNEITMIRFGGFGKQGSETWSPGMKLRPDQEKKIRAVLGETPVEEDYGDLC